MVQLNERIRAIFILHALGDTIGFRNGKWEFFGVNEMMKTRKFNFEMSNELLYEFIALGGINGIDLKDWFVSDDTLLHLDLTNALLETQESNIKVLLENTVKRFKKTKLKYFDNRVNIDRAPGVTTVKYIDKADGSKYTHPDYDLTGGGNGSAMRAPVIGIFYYKNIDRLIEVSIETSKITHNCAIGYLGAVNVAFFIALAFNGVHLHKWPYELIKLLESEKITKYINKDNDREQKDYEIFLNSWKKYVEKRFDSDKKPGFRRSAINLVFRTQFYFDNFIDQNYGIMLGASGYLVNIMAYDALLDSEDKWEKLVVYSMLHLGDSDTVGCIAAAWYGALYGFGDVPKSNTKYLEFKSDIEKIADKTIDHINAVK